MEQWRDGGSAGHRKRRGTSRVSVAVQRIVADRSSIIAEGLCDTDASTFKGRSSKYDRRSGARRSEYMSNRSDRAHIPKISACSITIALCVCSTGRHGDRVRSDRYGTSSHGRVKDLAAEPSQSSRIGGARFSREARALAGIRHPHVVSIYSVSATEEGLPYLTMELVAGETLEQILQRERVIEPFLAARWVADVGDGLAAAHQTGLIHRDIKPSNILLTKQSEQVCAKLADFGLARFTTCLRVSHMLSVLWARRLI